jgi:hypothetical protein
MAILRIRDADGNVQEVLVIKGERGEDYVLTEADKREIAAMISAGIADVPSQVSELGNDAGYITANDLQCYALKADIPTVPTNVSAFTNDAGYLTQHQSLSDYALKTEIPAVPTKVSAFTNDAGYLTQHQSLAGYALKTEIPNVSAYQTEAQVKALIQTETAGIVSGLPQAETWTFTLEDGSTVTKAVCVK